MPPREKLTLKPSARAPDKADAEIADLLSRPIPSPFGLHGLMPITEEAKNARD